MFVELASIPFDATVTYEGVIDDKELLASLLPSVALSEFGYTVNCRLVDGGLQVDITVDGSISSLCDLCGKPTVAECHHQMDEMFTESDPEFDRERKGYDLDKFLQDCICLSVPRSVKCRPDCKGICLKCGANLNEGPCNCVEKSIGENNPFGKLQDIIINGGAKNGSTKK